MYMPRIPEMEKKNNFKNLDIYDLKKNIYIYIF